MKTAYHLLRHTGELFIYMTSEMECPPLMNLDILDTWVTHRHRQYTLPHGCKKVVVLHKPNDYLPTIEDKDIEVLETHEVGKASKPKWLTDFRVRVGDGVDKWLLVGDPAIFGHLVPIQMLDEYRPEPEPAPGPFVSVDPISDKFVEEKIQAFSEQYEQKAGIKSRVLVTGCFDLIHAGHIHFLKEVHKHHVGHYKELCVGIPDDADFYQFKKRKPIYPFEERKAILESIEYVRKVVKFPIWKDVPAGSEVQDGHRYLLDIVKPVLFVDSRQKPKERIGIMPFLKERNIPIEYVDSIDIHVGDILDRIKRWIR